MGVISGISSNVVLGAIAGMTIFLGLPVARWKGASEKLRGALALGAVGILLFLIIEVGSNAIEIVEASAKSGDLNRTLWQGVLLIVGLVIGLVGLAWLEEKRSAKRSEGASPLEIANMIAIGIGLHNFAEGLAIGQSFSGGQTKLGLILVIGFALHNATEGFGIAGPLAGQDVSWGTLALLGLIGGGPTVLGSVVGGSYVNVNVELFFLALAVGSLIYVTRELLRLRFATLSTTTAMSALTIGLLLGIATEIVVEAASLQSTSQAQTVNQQQVRFEKAACDPSSIAIARGDSFTLVNETEIPLEFEDGGLIAGEAFVPAKGQTSVTVIGAPGVYKLSAEGNKGGVLKVTVAQGQATPLLDKIQAVAALITLEGHVRAAHDLHERALGGRSNDGALDLKRAGKHAHHPKRELLEDTNPRALMIQKLLKRNQLLKPLKEKLDQYSKLAGDKDVLEADFDQSYDDLLATAENARVLIGGDQYTNPSFRASVVKLVLESAEGEYKEATESGRIEVSEAAVPGKDGYLEYQDTRGFLQACHEFLERGGEEQLSLGAQRAMATLLNNKFADSDPIDPGHPEPFPAIEKLIDQVEDGLPK